VQHAHAVRVHRRASRWPIQAARIHLSDMCELRGCRLPIGRDERSQLSEQDLIETCESVYPGITSHIT
jgi:hypothetical protein